MNLPRAARAPSLRPVIAKNGDTDVQVRLHVGAPTPIAIQRAFFMPAVFVMAAVRGRSFGGLPGSDMPGLAHLRTAATLIRVQAEESSLHHISEL